MKLNRSIPIIKLYDTLIVSVQTELSDHLVMELKDNIADEIRASNAKGLIIEVSGVDIIDSFIARSIRDIAKVSNLMGVDTIVAGLDAGMAITLVEMGMVLNNVRTKLNLESALHAFGLNYYRDTSQEEELDDFISDTGGTENFDVTDA